MSFRVPAGALRWPVMEAPSDWLPALHGEALPELDAIDHAARSLLGEHPPRWQLELAEPGLLGLRRGQRRVALLQHDAAQPSRAWVDLERILHGAYPAGFVLVFGADLALRRRLEALARAPRSTGPWLYVADASEPWQSRAPRWWERRFSRALVRAAARARTSRPEPDAERYAYRAQLSRERQRIQRERRELEDFRDRLQLGRPRATFALLGVIALVFALQAAWGGTDLPPLLARMGSMIPERARDGEWWRYFSSTFLHGGVAHVLANGLGLWMLGRSLESFLGSSRFLLIYFCAGLAGSIASSLVIEGQGVGASGAIWGLLGAEAALAFYPRPLLPPALARVARRAVGATLTLNVVASFNPHVDWAAHAGGGVMGALVLAALAATGQLPVQRQRVRRGALQSWALRTPAAALALVFAAGLAAAQLTGRPWLLGAPPELVRVDWPGAPWSLEVPRTVMEPRRVGSGVEFGSVQTDASMVDVASFPLGSAGAAVDPAEELAAIQAQLRKAPDGLEVVTPPEVSQPAAGGMPLVTVRYRYESGPELVYDRAIGIVDGSMVRVDVIGWRALPAAFEGLAVRVLRSIGPAQHASEP